MAVVTVTEYEELARDADGRTMPIPFGSPLNTQVLTLSGTSQAIATAFDVRTKIIEIATTGSCHFTFADTPIATTSSAVLPEGSTRYYGLDSQMGDKVAFIQVA